MANGPTSESGEATETPRSPKVHDLSIRFFAFGWPANNAAYLSLTDTNGDTYRMHFNSKKQISLLRSYSSQAEDQWPD